MSNSETLADILAEMRKHDPRVSPDIIWDEAEVREHDEYYADRIEAASARDIGNAAAMRAALEFAEEELWAHGLFDSSKRVAAALAAPPRNCDRYATLAAATDAWRMENRTWLWADENTAANYMKARALPDVGEFLDWLFAPAEGGAE